jgi:hypothetical protein
VIAKITKTLNLFIEAPEGRNRRTVDFGPGRSTYSAAPSTGCEV